MKLEERLRTLPQGHQLRVLERVFQKLTLAFGNQMQAKWQGIDMELVYSDWAESLQEYTLGAINNAIDLAKQQEHPPSLGSFASLCKAYKPPLIAIRLEKPKTNSEEGLRRIAAIRDQLCKTLVTGL